MAGSMHDHWLKLTSDLEIETLPRNTHVVFMQPCSRFPRS